MAEYEYGSKDSWDIRPKGRNRQRERERTEEGASKREEEEEAGCEPKLNGKSVGDIHVPLVQTRELGLKIVIVILAIVSVVILYPLDVLYM